MYLTRYGAAPRNPMNVAGPGDRPGRNPDVFHLCTDHASCDPRRCDPIQHASMFVANRHLARLALSQRTTLLIPNSRGKCSRRFHAKMAATAQANGEPLAGEPSVTKTAELPPLTMQIVVRRDLFDVSRHIRYDVQPFHHSFVRTLCRPRAGGQAHSWRKQRMPRLR